MEAFQMIFDNFQYLSVFLNPQQAIPVFNDGMGTACIKSGYNLTVLIKSPGKLCLIAVSPWLVHSHDGQHRNLIKSADSCNIIIDFPFFVN